MLLNISVKGQENRKFINRLCYGEYDEKWRGGKTVICTSIGRFEINLIPDDTGNIGDYLINFDQEIKDEKNVFNYKDGKDIVIKQNYEISKPIFDIIKKITGNNNVHQTEGPPEIPPEVII